MPEELAKLDPRLIETICHEVVDAGHGVSWDDIAGQEAAKRLIQEVVVWPMRNPDLFQVCWQWELCVKRVEIGGSVGRNLGMAADAGLGTRFVCLLQGQMALSWHQARL